MKKSFYCFFIFLIAALGCEEEKKLCCLPPEQRGTVLYFGDPAVDGCGWLIEINEVLYSPITLDSNFKKDSLQVLINYHVLTTTWNCGWREPGYSQIRIDRINKL